jgi:hypothetical protein
MIAGAYTLDLYCENNQPKHGGFTDDFGHTFDEFPHTYVAQTRQECITQARKNGWLVNWHKDRALCPKCSKKRSL